jgi:actin-related protein
MSWVYDHMPMAGIKKAQWELKVIEFKDILDGLSAETKVIDNAANASLGILSNYLPTTSLGDYRDVYADKADEWLIKATDIRTRFNSIGTELGVRIANTRTELANAQSQVSHWDAMTKVRHWESDK